MDKGKAIMLAISDNYSFAAANLMMSIKDNSPKVFSDCEFIIYNNGLSRKNIDVLKRITERIKLLPILDNNIPKITSSVYNKSKKAGQFGLEKLNAFELIKDYKTILWLETDVFVNKPIDYLFQLDCDISAVALGEIPYDTKTVDLSSDSRHCRAAVVVFNDSLSKLNITKGDLKARCDEFIDLKPFVIGAALDEKLLGYLVSYYKMDFFNLPRDYHAFCREYINKNTFDEFINSSVQHFADGPDTKPWMSDCLFRAMPKWAANYHKFIEMGGQNYPVLCQKESFFNDVYSFNVIRSLSMLRPVFSKLDIVQDRSFFPDFYQSQDVLRFVFRHTNGTLFICISWRGTSGRYSVSLNMTYGVINKNLILTFKNTYEDIKNEFNFVRFSNQSQELKLTIEYTDINYTNQYVNILTKLGKSILYKRIYMSTRKRKIIRIIIKMLVDSKRYNKLKRDPKKFFSDSKSTFIRLLGRYYN